METGNYRLAPLGFGWSERLLSRHTESDRHSRNIVLEGECCDRLYGTFLRSRQKYASTAVSCVKTAVLHGVNKSVGLCCCPSRAYCLGSISQFTCLSNLLCVKPSKTLAKQLNSMQLAFATQE